MGDAAFKGWLFPGVPETARLVYVDGRAQVPAVAASVNATGALPFGGAGFLYRAAAFGGERRWKHRLVAIGAGLYDYGDLTGGSAVLGGGAAVNVFTLLGLVGPTPVPFRSLVLTPSVTGFFYVRGGVTPIAQITPSGVELVDGHILPTDTILAPAAGGTIHAALSRMPESRRFSITISPFRARFASDGTFSEGQFLGNGYIASVRPEAREDGGFDLWPVSADGYECVEDEYGFGANVGQPAGGDCPTSAVVHVRGVIAVWSPGE